MPRLPAFSLDTEISAADGREDKIELSLGTFTVQATTEEMDAIRHAISVPPEIVREHGDPDEIQSFGWVFNRPNAPLGRRNPLQVRTRSLPMLSDADSRERPLFGGHWVVRGGGSGPDGQPRPYFSELQLSLNPLRFVRNQRIPRGNPSNAPVPPPNLCEVPGAGMSPGEFSLDGETNWIPDTPIFRAFASPARWDGHLRRYIRGITDAFRSELNRVANSQLIHPGFSENFRLRRVETAWEFAVTEPTELVMSLAPFLTSYKGRGAETRLYPPMIGRIENALSITIPLRQGVSLRVYAKTNRRIRFEIIHEEMNIRELLGEPPLEQGQVSHQPRPHEQIIDCLSAIRARAAVDLNTVFRYLRRRSAVSSSAFSPLRFLVSVATVLNDEELTHTILSLLVHNGIVASRRASPELVQALNALASAGILAYDAARRGYDVTTPYREPLSAFRSVELRRLTTTTRQRQRRRTASEH